MQSFFKDVLDITIIYHAKDINNYIWEEKRHEQLFDKGHVWKVGHKENRDKKKNIFNRYLSKKIIVNNLTYDLGNMVRIEW